MFMCRRFAVKCGGCLSEISPDDFVRCTISHVFHLSCFTCLVCRKKLNTGDEMYVLDVQRFICKEDYLMIRLQGKNYKDPYFYGVTYL